MFFDFHDMKRKWTAQWIWDGSNVPNTWMNFRKKFTLDHVPEKAVAYISAESRYWLYVNGKNVVYEGSLKRCLNVNDGFFDEVELSRYLVKGENVIFVLAWYWGENRRSFSSVASGKPAFIFEADLGEIKLESDRSWKCTKNVAFIDDTGKVPGVLEKMQPTDNLPEYNTYYDGRLDMGDLASPRYDDSGWPDAVEFGTVPTKPWNELLRRPIPLFKDYGLKDYKESAKYENYTAKENETLLLHTEYNCQMTPFIELETDVEGLKIDMYAENIVPSPKDAYVTRKGTQKFEGFTWFNGENVFYVIPKGVTIKKLQYRETGYNTAILGQFNSDDDCLNKLWKMSARTLYITMRDGFMDCPDRERAQWWGDATNEMLMLLYCLDTRAYSLYEKAWYSKIGFAESLGENKLRTVVPTMPYTDINFELPVQELTGICGLWEYYLYTGNRQIIEDVYPYVKKYLYLWKCDENGIILHHDGSWNWEDWGENIDEFPLEIAWYYFALGNTVKIAKALGKNEDIDGYEERRRSIRKSFEAFFTDEGFKSENQAAPDDRVNAIAVASELNVKGREEIMRKVFSTVENSSPYMEKYVEDAMFRVSTMEELQERMKKRFDEMMNGPEAISTLWEHWHTTNGTRNHAWSGGSLIAISKYMAGIRPTSPAFATYEIAPSFGTLTHIEVLVPTVKGNILAVLDKKNEAFSMTLDSPAGTVASVKIPLKCNKIKVNGAKFVIGKKAINKVCGAAYLNGNTLNLASGKWEIVAE